VTGRDLYPVVNIFLVVKSGLMLSAGLAVFATFLLKLKRLQKFELKRITKIIAVAIVLLPIMTMFLVPAGEGVANPSATRPWGIGGNGQYRFESDFSTTRVYDAETGMWTYSLRLYNRGPENTTITKILAGHEIVEPLSARVKVNGTGISVTAHGIVFEPGASGFMAFTTAQGHNRITLMRSNDSVNTFSW